jgi:hypothetical protein
VFAFNAVFTDDKCHAGNLNLAISNNELKKRPQVYHHEPLMFIDKRSATIAEQLPIGKTSSATAA